MPRFTEENTWDSNMDLCQLLVLFENMVPGRSSPDENKAYFYQAFLLGLYNRLLLWSVPLSLDRVYCLLAVAAHKVVLKMLKFTEKYITVTWTYLSFLWRYLKNSFTIEKLKSRLAYVAGVQGPYTGH